MIVNRKAVIRLLLEFIIVLIIFGQEAIIHAKQSTTVVQTLDWRLDSTQFAVGYNTGVVEIRDAVTNTLVASRSFMPIVSDVSWSPNSPNILAVSGGDANTVEGLVAIYDVSAFDQAVREFGFDDPAAAITWHKDGELLAIAVNTSDPFTDYTWLGVFNVNSGAQIWEVRPVDGDESSYVEIAWSPDGNYIAASLSDRSIVVLDASTGSTIRTLQGHGDIPLQIVWSPDSAKLASVSTSGDRSLKIWDIQAGTLTRTVTLDSPIALDWRPDGTQIAVMDLDKLIFIDSTTGNQIETRNIPGYFPVVAYAPSGNQLAYGGANGTVEIVPAPTTSARVTDNLLALYTFEEGSGTTVNDVSGVGSPVNLTISSPTQAAVWGEGFLRFTGSPQGSNGAFAAVGTNKLHTALPAANALTVEAWVTPANITQQGPARAVTFSSSIWTRNFTIGQSLTQYDFRLRTTTTDSNGIPGTLTPSNTAAATLQHIVTTRDTAGNVTIYINGVSVATSTRAGDFSGWDTAMRFGVGNEISLDRPWLGDVHLVAVYDRALSAAEVTQNTNAGTGDGETGFAPENVVMQPDVIGVEEVLSAAPSADAGADVTVTDANGDGFETVPLSASGSSDDGEIVEYLWGFAADDEPLARGIEATLTLPVGAHEILLIVVDAEGQIGSDTVIVTVGR